MEGLFSGRLRSSSLRRMCAVAAALAMGLAFWAAARGGSAQDAAGAKPDAGAKPQDAAPPYAKRWEDHPFTERVAGSCFNCHETIAAKPGRPARLHLTGAHYRAGVTCQDCHGGDPTAQEDKQAHDESKGWLKAAKFDLAAMNERCGKCHQQEVETFNKSKHIHDYENVRKLNCATCHTSHQAGAPTRNMSWGKTCNECHSLEDVPDLPKELVAMMASQDEVHARLRKLRYKLFNMPYPADVMEPYRQVRQLSADLVHATRAKQSQAVGGQVIDRDKALIEKINKALAE